MNKPLSVYLCGFMGCGKSHVGRQIAVTLGRRFIDLDRYIVNAERMTIPEIFDKFGEPHFRQLEAKYIRELSDGSIVATGGGALINDETAAFACESGLSVYINTAFDVCYNRISGDTNRPLVVNNTPAQLRELYDKRAVIYRRNSVCMVNGNARDSIIAEEIVKLVRYYEEHLRPRHKN